MPLTLPTHPVAVLPLKLWRPRWFDGVALTLGTLAPDVPYALNGYGVDIRAHSVLGPLWWAVPFVLVTAPVVRWASVSVAAHLPAGGPLALRDYGVLGTVRHRWWVTAWSALIGAVSHLLWDLVTHPAIDGGTMALPALRAMSPFDRPWFQLICNVSDSVGFGAAMAVALYCGQARLLRRWHGEPPAVHRRPALFWTVTGAVLAAGLATLPAHPSAEFFAATGVRAMLVFALALLAGAVAVRLAGAHNRSRGRDEDRHVVGAA